MSKIPWWQWLPIPWWRIVVSVDAADEIPTKLPHKGAVLVGSHRQPKWLAFDCPCRRGHRVMVTLDVAHQPHWTIKGDLLLTLWPSVDDHTAGRRCHYIIRNGRTLWAD
ncbi:MAG: DUF6527 family protein [Acidithiobacillus sp.]